MRKWALAMFVAVLLTASACAARVPFQDAAAGEPAAAVDMAVAEPDDVPGDALDDEIVEAEPVQAVELPLLVNNEFAIPDGYKPEKLVTLYNEKRSFKLADSDIKIEEHVFQAMNQMFKAAKADGVTGFIITSGYRGKKKQQAVYEADKKGVAAKPGYSEHQTGLAFDVVASGNPSFNKTKQFKWLKAHCFEYGFILRYPKGKEHITGIKYEPWHYRFVGVEVATAITQAGITLEEYCGVYVEPDGGAESADVDDSADELDIELAS